MKGFKIPSSKEIIEKRISRKKLKVGDTLAVDRVTSGVGPPITSIESSPQTASSWKRDREEEEDN